MSNRIDRVIITGAGSGIGLDLAKRFLGEGSSLVINGRDPERLERARQILGEEKRVAAVAGPVGDPGTGRALAKAALDRFGGVDVLVNNTGIFEPKPFLESTEEDLDRFYATNVRGTFLTTKSAVPLMIRRGGGSVINLGTALVAQAMTRLPVAALMTSKGGVHALTVALAAELARYNIRVNTLAPGVVRTPLIGAGADSMAAIHPLGRIGEVRDTSDAVLYLATASFVTGTTLEVDGGFAHSR